MVLMRRGVKKNFLLLLAFLVDVRNEMSLHTSYKRFWYPNYKPVSIYPVVSRMFKVGDITKGLNRNGEPVIRLTAQGGKLLDEVIPLKRMQKKKWDGKWRLVIFDIAEKKRKFRETLRNQLKKLGFGMWQKSVYVTPNPVMGEVNEFLKDNGLFGDVVCFESRRAGFGNDREFAEEIFGLGKINKMYEQICTKAEALSFPMKKKQMKTEIFEQRFAKIWNQYLYLQLTDPYLPRELLPRDWKALKARELVRKLALMVG